MTDPYRFPEATESPRPEQQASTRNGFLRPVLWVVLVVCAALEVVLASAGVSAVIGSVFGAVVLACAIALIVHHYRNRRR